MRKIFITYGDERYRDSLARIRHEALLSGCFDEVRLYTPDNLPEPFSGYTRKYARGGGYWLWKPYIISHALDKAADGDIVVYADAGCTIMPHRDWERYFKLVEGKEELFFIAAGKNRKWCKREVFECFHKGSALWRHAPQIQATFIIARKSGENSVIREWYETALGHPELFTDVKPEDKNRESGSFREHRHDQAILSACVYTAPKPWRFCLKTEKVEHRYAGGQAVFASRISNDNTRSTERQKGRTGALAEYLFTSTLRIWYARAVMLLGRL